MNWIKGENGNERGRIRDRISTGVHTENCTEGKSEKSVLVSGPTFLDPQMRQLSSNSAFLSFLHPTLPSLPWLTSVRSKLIASQRCQFVGTCVRNPVSLRLKDALNQARNSWLAVPFPDWKSHQPSHPPAFQSIFPAALRLATLLTGVPIESRR